MTEFWLDKNKKELERRVDDGDLKLELEPKWAEDVDGIARQVGHKKIYKRRDGSIEWTEG
jgi:hypothetical protein